MIVGVKVLTAAASVIVDTTVETGVVMLVARVYITVSFRFARYIQIHTLTVVTAVSVTVDVGVGMDRQLQADDNSAPLVYAEKHDGFEMLEVLLDADGARFSLNVTPGAPSHPVGYAVA